MPVVGTSNLPVADRNHPWDGAGARRRVLELCDSVACASRAFLWRNPDMDPRTQAAWSLGYADVIDGRLRIVPRGVAAAAGGRGVNAASIPEEDKARIRARLSTIYERVRAIYDDWPPSPFAVTADASGDAWEGTIAFEGETTGDRRRILPEALRWEDGPWPLVFDRDDMDHSGMVVGTVDEIFREGREIRARGHLSDSEDPSTQASVQRVRELLAEGAVGVSIMTDDDEVEDDDDVLVVRSARIRHLAIVDVPAFHRARVALVAAVNATEDWFTDPGFGKPGEDSDERLVWQAAERPEETPQWGAPLTVTDDGRIWGHAALWGRCHVGFPGTCVRPPKEPAAYRGFLTGERFPGIPTGPLVMRTRHAPDHIDAERAQIHYAHTGYAVADVAIGPDAYGIWVAGAVRPDATTEDIEILRASALSGDWRIIGGHHRLIGILAVNAPGFRVARALAASGTLLTVGPGCDSCDDQPTLEDRIADLEARLESLGA